MGRKAKFISEPCCYHITHRCQERRFLFKFNIDRLKYVERLREMKTKYNVDVLDYIVTSNHVHLLLWARKAKYVSDAMHFLQSITAKDYNKRVLREGAFWRGRYHPTIIEPGKHLSYCLFYIDLNMLRAGVIKHPDEWKCCGYHELAGIRKRYCIINIDRLMNCLEINDRDSFQKWYTATLNREVETAYHCQDPVWSESLAVGSKEWIENISRGLLNAKIFPIIDKPQKSGQSIRESRGIYSLKASAANKRDFWKKQQNIS